ncbi:cytochrome P450 [Actinomadura madurae]|nr:cytochrome P450 [Actinomadura madurae]MCQ0013954.1 cytochrome P450 [Actinomadura madurae]
MPGDASTASQIPGPPTEDDGGAAIAAAGGLHNYQLELHGEYGPVVRFPLPGAGLAVSVADPVLLEATAKIDKRPEKLFEFLAPLQESGNLQTIPAAEHGPWRRVMLSVLAGRPSHEAHFAQFTALATGMADRWSARAADGPVALQKDLSELSLSMICQYALGSGLGSEESAGRVVSAFETVLTHYMGQADASGGEEARRAEEALAYLRATTDEVLAAHRERDDADRSDLIAALAAAGESPARIRDTVLMTMLAAHHTTGVAISWTLYLLARHPDAAERATAEVDEVLGDRPAPDYGDLRKLAHLDAVVKEAMRLYPPGPYGARGGHRGPPARRLHRPGGHDDLLSVLGRAHEPRVLARPGEVRPRPVHPGGVRRTPPPRLHPVRARPAQLRGRGPGHGRGRARPGHSAQALPLRARARPDDHPDRALRPLGRR